MWRLSSVAALLALSAGALICANAGKDTARAPVLLELFTSEGCSSCPPADQLLEALDRQQPVRGADLIVLSEHVDYWDRLGWKDPFSSPQYTARQQAYAAAFNLGSVYTPQLVIDGRAELVGSDSYRATSAIEKALRVQKIAIAISHLVQDGNQITAHIELPGSEHSISAGKAVLYVAVADDRVESRVTSGENAGRSLAHVAVLRTLKQVGTFDLDGPSTRDVTLSVQPGARSGALRVVAFIQDPGSGHVLGVAARKL